MVLMKMVTGTSTTMKKDIDDVFDDFLDDDL